MKTLFRLAIFAAIVCTIGYTIGASAVKDVQQAQYSRCDTDTDCMEKFGY